MRLALEQEAARMRRKWAKGLRRPKLGFRGEWLTLGEWAKKAGLPKQTLESRLKAGKPMRFALLPTRRAYGSLAAQRERIWAARAAGASLARLAAEFGAHRSSIQGILRGRW